MKVNYFDLGLHHGTELRWMATELLPNLGLPFEAHGFEASLDNYNECVQALGKIPDVHLHRKAVAKEQGVVRLYHSKACNGHSIYASKINVNESDYEEVEGIRFSDFFYSVADEEDFNILRFNIEGAEWDLLNDIVATGVADLIDIFGGSDEDDMLKVLELRDKCSARDELLEDNGIKIHYFCCNRKGWKSQIREIIEKAFSEHKEFFLHNF